MIRVYQIDNEDFTYMHHASVVSAMVHYWKNKRELFREIPNKSFLDNPVDCRAYQSDGIINTILVRHAIPYWSWNRSWWPIITDRDILMVDGRLGVVQNINALSLVVSHENDVVSYSFCMAPLDLRGIDLPDLSDHDRDWVIMEMLR